MTADSPLLERLPTGIPGLDAVLAGGLVRGSIFMVRGRPGAGKTTLAAQTCFHHVATGGRALYVTLLAESHARLFANLSQFGFFRPDALPDALSFVSAFHELESSGLRGLVELVRRELRVRRCSLLVVDGLVAARDRADNDSEFKKFVHELQGHANLTGTTSLLLTSGDAAEVQPEETMVDGILDLVDELGEVASRRWLHVPKFRGSACLRGRHSFRIGDHGITVFPRLEARFETPSRVPAVRASASLGSRALDAMLGGGVPDGTATLVLGPPGSGKTVLGLQFLARSAADEPGLFFGFYETPQRVLMKSDELALPLRAAVEAGHLELIWRAPTEALLDQLGAELLGAVERRGVRRLVIDGLDGFVQTEASSSRLLHFLTALMNELRARGVTALLTAEGAASDLRTLPMPGLYAAVENQIELRLAEDKGRLRRTIAVTKVRESGFDERVLAFRIDRGGIRVDAPAKPRPKKRRS